MGQSYISAVERFSKLKKGPSKYKTSIFLAATGSLFLSDLNMLHGIHRLLLNIELCIYMYNCACIQGGPEVTVELSLKNLNRYKTSNFHCFLTFFKIVFDGDFQPTLYVLQGSWYWFCVCKINFLPYIFSKSFIFEY